MLLADTSSPRAGESRENILGDPESPVCVDRHKRKNSTQPLRSSWDCDGHYRGAAVVLIGGVQGIGRGCRRFDDDACSADGSDSRGNDQERGITDRPRERDTTASRSTGRICSEAVDGRCQAAGEVRRCIDRIDRHYFKGGRRDVLQRIEIAPQRESDAPVT